MKVTEENFQREDFPKQEIIPTIKVQQRNQKIRAI